MLARPELDDTSHKMLAAADLLKQDGWTTFTRLDPTTGKRCLLGALDDVGATYAATKRLAAVLPFVHGEGDSNSDAWKVANWNNLACKSAEEAANKLREAAYAPVNDYVE